MRWNDTSVDVQLWWHQRQGMLGPQLSQAAQCWFPRGWRHRRPGRSFGWTHHHDGDISVQWNLCQLFRFAHRHRHIADLVDETEAQCLATGPYTPAGDFLDGLERSSSSSCDPCLEALINFIHPAA